MENFKKPYEISLWEDVLVFVVQDGNTIHKYEETIEGVPGTVIAQYYKEKKICTIGSDTLDSPIRAISPKLETKINGENILTFNIHSHYYDVDDQEYYMNPYIKYLINERKVKLRYGELGATDTKWYDLIIKNITENSDTKTYTYVAKDQFINELSKSGFDLVFDSKLENNTGNITFLGKAILEGSDWRVKEESSVILKQTLEEPLYKITLKSGIAATNIEGKDKLELKAGQSIYAFYSCISNKESFIQFLNVKDLPEDSYAISENINWCLQGVEYNDNNLPTFASSMTLSQYRGNRLVRKPQTKYDSTIDKYVTVYEDKNGKIKYGYTKSEYVNPATVRSYVTNPNSFDSTTGWNIGSSDEGYFPSLSLVSVPDMRDIDIDKLNNGTVDIKSCLKFEINSREQTLYNSGIVDMRHQINGFTKGEKYVFRVKYGQAKEPWTGHGPKELIQGNTALKIRVAQYNLENGRYKIDSNNIYFESTFTPNHQLEPYYLDNSVTCQKSLSYSDMVNMTNNLGLFIQINPGSSTGIVYIEDVQFFPEIKINGEILLPNEEFNGEIKTKYLYYTPDPTYTKEEDVVYTYKDYVPNAEYTEVYNANFEKIRSITASESNRFNLIQDLSETFECWPKFEIEHDPLTGEILIDEEDGYRQKKWISFQEYIGKENYAGFKYGINLKSITRSVDSEGIISKLVVKNNSNEFATDGFCSIARASESLNGENFIIDFSYYIQQGMLGMEEVTNDLYAINNQQLGYYKKLKNINLLRDQYIQRQSDLLIAITEHTANYQTYNLSAQEASRLHRDKLNFIKALTGYTFDTLMKNQVKNSNNKKIYEWWKNEQVLNTVASIGRLISIEKNHSKLANNAKKNLDKAQAEFDLLEQKLTSKELVDGEDSLLTQKEKLHYEFYKKYSRFLQEGSWISEDYIDDNLYYLDSQNILNTSAKPKITYNISVLELSQLENYENYNFALGDKTTIEDTEFFGWVWSENGVQTPYKEEIIVTDLIILLDSPEQNEIKVQNYKTQFEDLFQRMAAATQSIEYGTGKYEKAAGIVETDGTIKITTLQNSILNNALTLQNAKDQSVIWDETGITTFSMSNPAEIVRIVSGGIFLSIDGGVTWNTGITGQGINASQVTTGQLNVDSVNILNGSFPSFRWDKFGINAYEFTIDENTNEAQNFNYCKFVRLDQFGLYGINGDEEFNPLIKDPDTLKSGEDKIWEAANFALTWKGFQITSKKLGLDGYIRITAEDDIQLINKVNLNNELVEIDQVKIGLLGIQEGEAIYGLRLKDSSNQVVLEQSSQGKVWIRDELKIGTNDTSTVSLGYLKRYRNDETAVKDEDGKIVGGISQVIRAGDTGSDQEFIVYEDGRLEASGGYFKGEIHAESGTIGGLSISSIVNPDFEVVIESSSGTVFMDENVKVLTATLYKGGEPYEFDVTYQWYKNSQKIEGATEQTIQVPVTELGEKNQVAYQCTIKTLEEGE